MMLINKEGNLKQNPAISKNTYIENYDGICEYVYTTNHPEILSWTKFFHSRIKKYHVFETFENLHPRSKARAKTVGVYWYRFSSFMPWFLCQAAALMDSNEKRHYVIQTAFEELGMRNVHKIHPEMFWNAVLLTGLNAQECYNLRDRLPNDLALSYLKSTLSFAENDAEVMGILLGLEMPAIENIETIFSSLAYKDELIECLANHEFFKLHRLIELEHVRLTVSNFIRFCESDKRKDDFIKGFDIGVIFWQKFWSEISKTLSLAASRKETNEFNN
jgi:hypothetical protein